MENIVKSFIKECDAFGEKDGEQWTRRMGCTMEHCTILNHMDNGQEFSFHSKIKEEKWNP